MKKVLAFLFPVMILFFGCSGSTGTVKKQEIKSSINIPGLDTIKAGKFDSGRMWTFEYPPTEYFKEEYGFTPTPGWLDSVRLAALRFATYCSASFVSEDGLIMTNDHCARESAQHVSKGEESLSDSGFYAPTLKDERKVPEVFVDQLVLIRDVTDEINKQTENITDINARTQRETEITKEIIEREEKATGLVIAITPLYNGGRYSLYGYKRYKDVRLVFTPESQLGFFGGDYDNFTYPRYNLDCSFFRVYDDSGNPLKVKNFFRWNINGTKDGDPVFVVGNPGSTSRLNTVAQLEYDRDYRYPAVLRFYKNMINVYNGLMEQFPEKRSEYMVELLKYTNSEKVFEGTLKYLNDPVLMQKKRDFEKNFRSAVNSNPVLKSKYADLWDNIAEIKTKMSQMDKKSLSSANDPMITPEYVFAAQELLNIADELKLPEDQRSENYQGEKLDSLIDSIYPGNFEKDQQDSILIDYISTLYSSYGKDDPVVKKFTGGKSPKDAAEYILSKSEIIGTEQVKALVRKGPDAILNSSDPFIRFEIEEEKRETENDAEYSQLSEQEAVYNKLLGKALFEVYGTSIPPDATFTLRISDGVIKGYPYNGTIAPPYTTFYGMYDRYYSFDGEMPWDLPGKWKNIPSDFNLKTPFNFLSTSDIVGGNSGSPVLNKNGEVIGLAFDGNIESLSADFIYTTETNRMIGVDVRGMVEALKKIYKADRLVNELTR